MSVSSACNVQCSMKPAFMLQVSSANELGMRYNLNALMSLRSGIDEDEKLHC